MKKILLLLLVLISSRLFAQRQTWENFSYYDDIEHPFKGYYGKEKRYFDSKGNEYLFRDGNLVKIVAGQQTAYPVIENAKSTFPITIGSNDEIAFMCTAGRANYFVYFENDEIYLFDESEINPYYRVSYLAIQHTDKYVWILSHSKVFRFDKLTKSFASYEEFGNGDPLLSLYGNSLVSDNSSFVVVIDHMGITYSYNESLDRWDLLIEDDFVLPYYSDESLGRIYDPLSKTVYLVGKKYLYEYNSIKGLIINKDLDREKLDYFTEWHFLTEDVMVMFFSRGLAIRDNGVYKAYYYPDLVDDYNYYDRQSIYVLDNGLIILPVRTNNGSINLFIYSDHELHYEGKFKIESSYAFYKKIDGDVYLYKDDYDNRYTRVNLVQGIRNWNDTIMTSSIPMEYVIFNRMYADSNYVWILTRAEPQSSNSIWRIRRNSFSITGQLYYDQNQNSLREEGEAGFDGLPVEIKPSGIVVYPSASGKFSFIGEPGETYILEIPGDSTLDFVSETLPYTMVVGEENQIGVTLKEVKPQIRSNFYLPWPRCNTVSSTRLRIENTGYVTAGRVEVSLISDGRSAIYSEEAAFVNGDTLFFELTDLKAKNSQDLNYVIEWPDAMMMDESLTFKTEIKTFRNQQLVSTQQDSISTMLRCSYDPNDKSVMPTGVGVEKYTLKDVDLQYLIRFENTGNDTAYHVTIYDTLDVNLNKSTFKILGSSHEVQAEIHPSGLVVFYFENIMLPDTNTNMEAAQGFVRFSISPVLGLDERTVISNTAGIVFDSNPAIITNTVHNTMITEISDIVTDIREKEKREILYYPNPASEYVYIRGWNTTHTEVYNSQGILIIKTTEREISVRDWSAGIYLFLSVNEKGEKAGATRVMVY